MMWKALIAAAGLALATSAAAGTYRNPILYADYSDPDVIRADTNYYLGIEFLLFTGSAMWMLIGSTSAIRPRNQRRTHDFENRLRQPLLQAQGQDAFATWR